MKLLRSVSIAGLATKYSTQAHIIYSAQCDDNETQFRHTCSKWCLKLLRSFSIAGLGTKCSIEARAIYSAKVDSN